MDQIIQKVIRLITNPGDFFAEVREEPTTLKEMILNYAVFLAAIPAIANFIGYGLIGRSFMGYTVRYPMQYAIPYAIVWFVASIALLVGVSFIASKLADSFGGSVSVDQAGKAVIYSYTPGWVAGVFFIFLPLAPLAFLGGLYGLYLLYMATDKLLDIPKEKQVGYFVVLLVGMIVAGALTSVLANIVMPGIPRGFR